MTAKKKTRDLKQEVLDLNNRVRELEGEVRGLEESCRVILEMYGDSSKRALRRVREALDLARSNHAQWQARHSRRSRPRENQERDAAIIADRTRKPKPLSIAATAKKHRVTEAVVRGVMRRNKAPKP